MASNIFAWSLKNGLSFPFDYGCAFYVIVDGGGKE